MRTLILTCNTGEGHNSVAGAIREAYLRNGEFCEIHESLQFTSNRFSKIIGKGHVGMYRYSPKLFNKGYSLSEKHDSYFVEGSLVYKVLTRGVKKLYEFVLENRIDNIICVHPFSGLLVTELKKRYDIPVVSSIVATDYTCSPGTNSTKMDYYFIPHNALRSEFVSAGISDDRICVSGIPIKQAFFDGYSQKSARVSLNLPIDKKILLMCCGSMGCGPMNELADEIVARVDDNTVVAVVCGSNRKLYSKLLPKQSDKLIVVGFTGQMYEYISACDVFITKPGGISTTEAAVLSKPMIFVNAVGGCELRNKQFFEKLKCAFTVSSNADIPEKAVELLLDTELQSCFYDNLKSEFCLNGAQFIYNKLSNKETTF